MDKLETISKEISGVKSAYAEGLAGLEAKLTEAAATGTANSDELKRVQTQLEELRHDQNRPTGDYPAEVKSIGQQVIDSDEWKDFAKRGFRSNEKTTITLDNAFLPFTDELKTNITSGAVGSSTPGILTPSRQAGIIPLATRRLTLREFLRSAPTDSNTVEYIRETAAPVASPQVEASAKFETSNTFTIASMPVRLFASWLPISKQVMDDFDELGGWINRRLLQKLAEEEELQILAGDGTGQNLTGLLGQDSNYAGTHNAAADTALDRLRHAILELEEVDEQPDFIVVHPKNWHDIQLIKDEAGGANVGSYVVGSPLGAATVPTLWGRSVLVTTAISSGSFLVGSRAEATVWARQQAVIDISSEHASFFISNMLAVRAESRLCVTVNRVGAFLDGTFA